MRARHRAIWARVRFSAISSLLVLAAGSLSAEIVPQAFTEVRQIRELSPESAAKGLPVHLQGVVTVVSGYKSSFFFQDSTSGISVDRDSPYPELKAGERIELDGVTGPGKFAPIVKAGQIHILGNGAMPAPRAVDIDDLATGSLDSQWTTVHAFVRTAGITQIWKRNVLSLELDLGVGTVVTAIVREFDKDAWQHLPGSFISLRGVCGTVFNARRQFVSARFFISNLHDITIEHAGPTDLFARPDMPLSSIARFSSGKNKYEPIKIHGMVTYIQGADRLYVQSGSEGVLVHVGAPVKVDRGSDVEVVGYARNGDYAPSLEGATLRLATTQKRMPAAEIVEPEKVILDKDGFTSAPFDSLVVRAQGTLSEVIPAQEDDILLLRNGDTYFGVMLPKKSPNRVIPEIGSLVAAQGVCFTRVNALHEPVGFRVLIQSTSDLTVLRAASWWTAEHAQAVAVCLAVALALAVALLTFFRRESALRQLSLSDPLTGVHNRRGFVALAAQQWRLTLRNREAMLLFYIDVDKFKEINDTFGHKRGDVALQTVAKILQDCFRSSDIIGRLGGDEFAVIACKAASRTVLEERLAQLVAEANSRAESDFHLSLSVGSVQCDQSLADLNIEDLLTRADSLMYKEKAVHHRDSDRIKVQTTNTQGA